MQHVDLVIGMVKSKSNGFGQYSLCLIVEIEVQLGYSSAKNRVGRRARFVPDTLPASFERLAWCPPRNCLWLVIFQPLSDWQDERSKILPLNLPQQDYRSGSMATEARGAAVTATDCLNGTNSQSCSIIRKLVQPSYVAVSTSDRLETA